MKQKDTKPALSQHTRRHSLKQNVKMPWAPANFTSNKWWFTTAAHWSSSTQTPKAAFAAKSEAISSVFCVEIKLDNTLLIHTVISPCTAHYTSTSPSHLSAGNIWGGVKVNFPPSTLNKFKSFLLRFLWHLSQFFYFLFEETHN